MARILIRNVRLVFPGDRIQMGSLLLEGRQIANIDPSQDAPADVTVEGNGRLLTPGLVDIHVHGIEQFAFDNGAEDMIAAARRFARFGTTTVLPTLVPRSGPDMLNRLAASASGLDRAVGVNMPGLHLEGPFMALTGAGCEVIPGDLGLLEDLLAACAGKVRVMSLSPETPNVTAVIEHLRELGIVPFVTHTCASLAQSLAAIAAGARHATHLCNVFPSPPDREPGVRTPGALEAYLAEPSTTVDFIADGCHVDPLMIQLAVRAKGHDRVAMITDANIGAGLPPGEYPTPWGYNVRVEPGKGARIADPQHHYHGALAGSALTMNVGMANLLRWLDLPPAHVWALGTSTPARIVGMTGKGMLAVGADADLVLWNDDLTPACTWAGGELVYRSSMDASDQK